jgi:hypothetical protein
LELEDFDREEIGDLVFGGGWVGFAAVVNELANGVVVEADSVL